MEWCEHIHLVADKWYLFQKQETDVVATLSNIGIQEFIACPLCLKPRPEVKRKKLAEIMYDAGIKEHSFSPHKEWYPVVAEAAIRCVEEVIDSMPAFDAMSYSIHRKDLILKLRELL